MFQALVDPIAGNLALSALVACVPLITFFIMLIGVKAQAHLAAVTALAVAVIVAIVGWKMPVGYALISATQGAAFGAFPIVFIIVLAVWFYEVTVKAGRSEDLRKFFDMVGGGDIRIQAMLVAFSFGGLLEALAGFGAPIAITATMILALGVKPKRAALAVMLANTAPVAYGAVGTPITTAGNMVASGDAAAASATAQHIAAIVGHQAPLFAFFVPLLLVIILDGKRGARDCWAPAFVVGGSFAITQWWCSNFFAYELTDVIAALVSMAALVLFMKVWKPRGVNDVRADFGLPPTDGSSASELTASRIFMALVPYIVVVAVFGICKLGIPQQLAMTDIKIPWPFISDGSILSAAGKDPGTTYTLNLLSCPGTMILVAGVISAAIYTMFTEDGRYQMSMGAAANSLMNCCYRMRYSAFTIVFVLSLAYVMNFSGQTISIGQFLAGSGPAFAFISPTLGWVGTAVTGSDTSANALFSGLQYSAAQANPALVGVTPDLFLAANTMGGVVGKMISPQSLAIAAVATGEKEADIMKAVLPWSIGFLVALCILVFLQTNILNFMLP
ncbi:L-lactate permease [Slackia heliotrinireducens]|uniref:L-lactate permease n=1 Tax=Slackia heliotrinireducens (strain ATCC 29202 / DSM 20476 / NCTC 11029 / RHS 1) TaxID=471855 RepID=C7N7B6_SLAHD|nr:L-lactate permease [Slackia heliotrinireducens]ACV22801.1 L-lactate transport [Slackia heliotrinireducens DSM 20476]VEH01504.1 L-lactate permease [Slackia heliotrinireducens]